MVQRLLGLKLTKDIPVSQFRDNFRTQWLEYRKINPIMANEKDFLRPLMLMSLQDDSYDKVREKILADPSLTVDDFLEELRNREQILQGINGEDMTNIDGTAADPIRGRRTQTSHTDKSSKKTFDRSSGSGTGDSGLSGPWNIPLIPKSWMNMLGKGVFQTLLQWQSTAHGKNITVDQLRKQFEVVRYDTGGSGQGKKRGHSATRSPSSTSPSQSGGTNDSASPSPKKVKFALRESRRIITERIDTSSSACLADGQGTPFPDVTVRRISPSPTPDIHILIADSGNDQFLVTSIWTVTEYTGWLISLSGALAGRHSGTLFPVVSAVAKLVDSDNNLYCAIVHEALFDKLRPSYPPLKFASSTVTRSMTVIPTTPWTREAIRALSAPSLVATLYPSFSTVRSVSTMSNQSLQRRSRPFLTLCSPTVLPHTNLSNERLLGD